MTARTQAKAGRPRRSSLEMLEEAAAELFLEQGYSGTSIDDIATRAGVSRNTVFNYVRGKSDLLWVGTDRLIGEFADALALTAPESTPIQAVREAYLDTARRTDSAAVPWAVTHAELMGTREGLASSGLTRLVRHAEGIRSFLEGRRMPEDTARAAAFALAGAASAAIGGWIDAGVARESLDRYLQPAIDPVVRGFGERAVVAEM